MAAAFDAIVIGGGANGLVAAAALGKTGLRVLLLEEREAVGGQGRVVEFAPGFHAVPLGRDAGWLPPAVARGVGLSLDRAEPDAPLSQWVGPGEWLTLWRDPGRAADALRRYSAQDAARWPAFTTRLGKLAGFLEGLYQAPPPDIAATSFGDVFALLALARRLRGLGREDMTEFLRMMPMSVEELVDDWFEGGPVKAGVAAGGVLDLRQGPRSGGTTFVLLHHLTGAPSGAIRGRGFWRGAQGPDAFTRAAEEAARRHHVAVRTSARVARIRVRDDAVEGVALADGEEISAPRVLSTADPARTLLGLVDPVWLDPEFLHAVRQIKFRGATATVLYALDGLPGIAGLEGTDALAGVLTLTPSVAALERAADAAKYGDMSERPHVELTIPTRHLPELAPAGKHVLQARAQWVPYRLRDEAAWDRARQDALTDSVTAVIESAIPRFTSRVLHRVALTPRDVEERYGLTEGAVTQGELMLDQILFMRPVAGFARYAMPIRGLYLGGVGTHPGPGVLGGSGWLAAARVRRDIREP